jgi:hypothetical protein
MICSCYTVQLNNQFPLMNHNPCCKLLCFTFIFIYLFLHIKPHMITCQQRY